MTKVIAIAYAVEKSCWLLVSGMGLSAIVLFYLTMIGG
jgi:hypothetical protein